MIYMLWISCIMYYINVLKHYSNARFNIIKSPNLLHYHITISVVLSGDFNDEKFWEKQKKMCICLSSVMILQ